jgi:hypothetical protein
MAKTAYNRLEEIFTNQINVLNIAVPVYAVDLTTAKQLCIENNFDVQLVLEPKGENLQVYEKNTESLRPLHDSEVISESTPLIDVVDILCKKQQVFVKVKRNITHVVTCSDLDTIPVRIWLYGLISIFEFELKETIDNLPLSWENKLNGERLAKANELYQMKQIRNEEINLLGCIQLGDVGTIVCKSWEHFKEFFPSDHKKSKIKSSLNKINTLRDALAHGQKLLLPWSEIRNLVQIISFTLSRT